MASKDYNLIKELVSLLSDCDKDGIITKYIDGDLVVVKALLDAGACFLCHSVEVVSRKWFNPNNYYDKRDMTKTNVYKYSLRDLDCTN